MSMSTTLYYVHDPMCSWCYAFRPIWMQIQQQLPANIRVQYVLGGLAPDSDLPMPPETCDYVQGQWRKIIQMVPDTSFNFDFWEKCQPHRSTYPANRAVLLAREQGSSYETAMIHAIQDAYYQQARNPSDTATLCELAQQIGLAADTFAANLHSDATRKALLTEISFARSIGGNSFPSLFLQQGDEIQQLPHHYSTASQTLRTIKELTIKA
jgi:putative protein-disulfide isomerase